MNSFLQHKKAEKTQKNGDIYHIFWDLAPYLWPVFQDEMCDTGWGTNDWHKLQTWGKKRHIANHSKQMLGVMLREGHHPELRIMTIIILRRNLHQTATKLNSTFGHTSIIMDMYDTTLILVFKTYETSENILGVVECHFIIDCTLGFDVSFVIPDRPAVWTQLKTCKMWHFKSGPVTVLSNLPCIRPHSCDGGLHKQRQRNLSDWEGGQTCLLLCCFGPPCTMRCCNYTVWPLCQFGFIAWLSSWGLVCFPSQGCPCGKEKNVCSVLLTEIEFMTCTHPADLIWLQKLRVL